MNVEVLIRDLKAQGVELWVDGARLRYRAPRNILTSPVLSKMKENAAEIARSLNRHSASYTTFPLSYGQQALWYIYQSRPDSAVYNVVYPLYLRNVDASALRHAFRNLVFRHPILRTTYSCEDGHYVQKVYDHLEFSFEELDATTWKLDEFNNQLLKKFRVPFDLEDGPILRIILCRRSLEDYRVLLTVHHIAVDGWSLGILIRELFLLYANELGNTDSKVILPDVSRRYTDFVSWQREMLEGQEGEHLWKYWRRQLGGSLPVLNLPTDKPRPSVQTYGGDFYSFELDENVTEKITILIKDEEITLYMMFLAVFFVLLYRYTSQEDILVGSPTAGSNRAEFGAVVGYFVNMIVLRADFSKTPSFREFLRRVRKTVLDALAHQDFPFPLLVNRLQPDRDPRRLPLFQVVFSFLMEQPHIEDTIMNEALVQVDKEDRELAFLKMPQQVGAFDLELEIEKINETFSCTLKYSTDLFHRSTIVKMAEHFKVLVEDAVWNPDCQVSKLNMIGDAERNRLLIEWNSTTRPYPSDKTIGELFEEQAENAPNNLAVVFKEKRLTYGELNERSNQLARMLRAKGVKPESVVGIMVERSLEMIVGIMGIVKAGGAYLPIDPDYPLSRKLFMIEDAGCSIVLTQRHIFPDKREFSKLLPSDKVFYIEDSRLYTGKCSNPGVHNKPDNLAYIIYTSGSTGKPKGNLITQYNVIRVVKKTNYIEITQKDALLQLSNYGFDGSVFDMFGALLNGAKLVLMDREMVLDINRLARLIESEGVSIFFITTALFNALVDLKLECLKNIKKVLFGGERASVPHTRKAFEYLGPGRIVNVYGPTESTVFTTYYPVDKIEEPMKTVPIGKPISNTKVYILGKDDTLQPIGVPGELCISGDGLARGYLKRPDLGEEKFVENPFEPGTKMYRTGDLVRWLPDGNIEFLERIDNQVKIRGFRIELGEIESQLLKHHLIEQVTVIDREDKNGDKYLCAYFVANEELIPIELREYLSKELPDYMIPSSFLQLEKMPLNANGKVDSEALPEPDIGSSTAQEYRAPTNQVEERIARILQEILGSKRISIHDNFSELGVDSLRLIRLNSKIRKEFARDIPIVKLFQYTSIHSLARYLSQEEIAAKSFRAERPESREKGKKIVQKGMLRSETIERGEKSSATGFEIAVIGMAGRFPGAKSIAEFWNNLRNGVESITFFSDKELEEAGIDPVLLKDPDYVKAKGILSDMEYFDASFFGYSAKDAKLMDPQIRIFHEVAYEALEDAGYASDSYNGLIGVFAGASPNYYWESKTFPVSGNPSELFATMLLNDKDFLATRISYKLNLKGPSYSIQTACSTSLACVDVACQSLLGGKSDIALAGGVTINLPHKEGYLYQEGMILSSDGHVRAFDAQAKGTVRGEGIGVVVLKRLEDAVADNDNIYALIKGSAVNNDGIRKIGYTAPSVEGQAEVIGRAQQMAGVKPESIGYIETHGTGTPLGDPVEIEGLRLAFDTDKKGFCRIGSVKTNVGHCDAAAGIASFIKTVLALRHRLIPPNLNFTSPNPKIDFENSPFSVNTELFEWKNGDYPLRAGISAYGIGGTNAHVILEEAPKSAAFPKGREWKMIMLSAKTDAALNRMTENLKEFLQDNPDTNIADAAYTLQVGRNVFNHRRMAICSSTNDAIDALSMRDPSRVYTSVSGEKQREVVFLFPGQGTQYVNMGRELYEKEPVFREEMNRCFTIIDSIVDYNIESILFPTIDKGKENYSIDQTAVAQPILFSFEYSLARLLMKWGIVPSTMIGHSSGEYVAACLSGVLSLEDAIALVSFRGELIQRLPAGSMLGVPLCEKKLAPLLPDELSLAAVNSPSQCVVSGTHSAIDNFAKQLGERGYEGTVLHTSHAFHSRMMEPLLEEFEEKVKRVRLNSPTIPYISNVTGDWVTEAQVKDTGYWGKHLRQTVRFSDGAQLLLKEPDLIFIEIGPGRVLSTLLKQHMDERMNQPVVNLIRDPREEDSDSYYLLDKIGRLWCAGLRIDWNEFYSGETRHRISLPTYPFEHQYHWIEEEDARVRKKVSSVLGKRKDVGTWFYVPSWERVPLVAQRQGEKAIWLLFLDAVGLGSGLVKRLKNIGYDVATVQTGTHFIRLKEGEYALHPQNSNDYISLLDDLQKSGKFPDTIVHLWNVAENLHVDLENEGVDNVQNLGFYSLVYLALAIGNRNVNHRIDISVISNDMQNVIGDENICPEKATLLGPCRVIPQECTNIRCRSIDIMLPKKQIDKKELIEQLVTELSEESSEKVIAYRRNHRWVQTFKSIKLEEAKEIPLRLRRNGTYLITGGVGNIGSILAEYLAKRVQARLILIARSDFPDKGKWKEWLATHGKGDKTSKSIVRIQKLEEFDSDVLVLNADVANRKNMLEAISKAEDKFGKINGVFHLAGTTSGKSFGSINSINMGECNEQFRSKVVGTQVLERAFQNYDLDFCILFSSISTILGGLGLIAYSAANAFMDIFVHDCKSRGRRTSWMSINWDAWKLDKNPKRSTRPSIDGLRITPDEAEETFQYLFNLDRVNQVIVSTGDLQARIDQWVSLNSIEYHDDSNRKEEMLQDKKTESLGASETQRDEIEQRISEVWQECLGVDHIGMNDNFFKLGGDSLLAVQLISKLNRTLHRKLTPHSIINAPTLAKLTALIRAPSSDSKTPGQPADIKLPFSLVEFQKGNETRLPLFLMHPVGGYVYIYRDLAKSLGDDQPVYGVQAQALDGSSKPLTHVKDMAKHYIDVIRSVLPKGPYLLGGSSFGGILAFEMAQQLQRHGQDVKLLMMIDTPSPKQVDTRFYDDADILTYVLNLGSSSDAPQDDIQNLERDEQLKYFIRQEGIADKLMSNITVDQLRHFVNLFRINLRSLNNYKVRGYGGQIIFFRAIERDSINPHHPEKGWFDVAKGGVVVHEVPGNHITMNYVPHVNAIAKKLREYLDLANRE